MAWSRRAFLKGALSTSLALPGARLAASEDAKAASDLPGAPTALGGRFPDLRRRFVFEYYPWYAASPVRHWDQWDRVPPEDIASRYWPLLGPYDSRSRAVLERHARWIAGCGAGAINLSWWGQGSYEDQAVPELMDVMRDHDIKVAFHLEPYAPDHGRRFAQDVLFLLREYGEKRSYDALLLLQGPTGPAPVFKGFRTIVPREEVDCHGKKSAEWDFTPDDEWRRQTDLVRSALGTEFSGATFLADTVDIGRAKAGGFDGIAVYDCFVVPADYARHARAASEEGLLFSFNVNPGFDGIAARKSLPDECPRLLPFAPEANPPLVWERAQDRERAADLSDSRIQESFLSTLAVQTDAVLQNAKSDFLLVYLNSFNEWHEGTAFEPMLDASELTPSLRRRGYHNPSRGDRRLAALSGLLARAARARGA